jgi:hypothetical protein
MVPVKGDGLMNLFSNACVSREIHTPQKNSAGQRKSLWFLVCLDWDIVFLSQPSAFFFEVI